jgi:hypothetical protein
VRTSNQPAGVVRDDDGVGQQPARGDRADQGRLGHQTPAPGTEAEIVEVGTPPGLVGEGSALMGEQRGDDRLGHGVLDHVGHRRGVDHVLGVAGAQQLEDAQPALGRPGGEPGEAVVADVRGGLVAPGMARPGVVDRHPAGGRQPGLEDGVRLGVEAVLVRGQEGDDLALGDADAQRSQLDEQALGGDLPLDVLHQDVAHDPGAEVAGHLRRQRGDDLPPVRRQPPLPPVADDPRREHQILDRGGLVALAPRARGHRGGEDALLRDRGRAPAAAPRPASPARLGPPGRLGRPVHAAGCQPRPLRQVLQPGVLLTEAPVLLLQRRHAPQELDDQPLQLVGRQGVQGGKGWRRHVPSGSRRRSQRKPPKHRAAPAARPF